MTVTKNIAVIGCGNMATCLVIGMKKEFSQSTFYFSSASKESAIKIAQYVQKAIVCDSNVQAIKSADIVLMAVKPQQAQPICQELQGQFKEQALLLSVMAGITCKTLENWTNCKAITWVMPNTPSLIGQGAMGIYHNKNVSAEQKNIVSKMIDSVGKYIIVEKEDLINVVTAVSGSGPAYVFSFIEAMQQQAIKMGLNEKQANLLIEQTIIGSTKYSQQSDKTVSELRQQVCSPGGTTEQAINYFKEHNWSEIIAEAMNTCYNKAIELGKK